MAAELERSAERAQARAGVAGCGGVPATLGGPDRGTRAPRRTCSRRRTCAPARGRLRRRPRRSCRGRGRRGRRPPASAGRAAAGRDQPRRHLGTARPRSCCSVPPGGSSRSTPCSPAQTYLDAWGAALVAGALATPGGELLDGVDGGARRPRRRSPGRSRAPSSSTGCAHSDPRLPGCGRARRCARAVHAFLDDDAAADEWLHYGVARLQRRPDPLGLRGLGRREQPDTSSWRGPPVRLRHDGRRPQRAPSRDMWAGDFEDGPDPWRRRGRRQGGHRHPAGVVR